MQWRMNFNLSYNLKWEYTEMRGLVKVRAVL